jgi:hypothetical protein
MQSVKDVNAAEQLSPSLCPEDELTTEDTFGMSY